jgi:hypothetical protein
MHPIPGVKVKLDRDREENLDSGGLNASPAARCRLSTSNISTVPANLDY